MRHIVLPTVLFALSVSFIAQSAQAANTWLSGKVTAGGKPVPGVSCNLNTSKWESGKSYLSGSAVTDTNGEFAFKTVDDPDVNCYSNYDYGKYCSYSSAYCSNYCQSKEQNPRTAVLTGYELSCDPPWGSSFASEYSRVVEKGITIDFSGTQSHAIALSKKDKTLQVCVEADGARITSGVTCSVSGPGWDSVVMDASGCHDFLVGVGTYYVSCYCTKWDDCPYSCLNGQPSEVKETDTRKTQTVSGRRHNATLEVFALDLDKNPIQGTSVSLSNGEYGATTTATTATSSPACYASAYGTTDSSGKVTLQSIAGKHTVSVYPPYNYQTSGSGPSYASVTVPVNLNAGETVTKRVALRKKDSRIRFSFKDSDGTALQGGNANISANSENLNDWGWGQADARGVVEIQAISGVRYNRSCSYWSYGTGARTDIGHCAVEGEMSVEAPADVSCTFPLMKNTCHFTFIDASGNAPPNVKGSVTFYATNQATAKGGVGTYPACSENMSTSEANSAMTRACPADTAMKADLYTWDGQYDSAGTYSFTTGAAGALTEVKIPVLPVNAKIAGKFVDQNGATTEPGSQYASVSCSRDNMWKGCTMDTASTYSCNVSAGRWCCGYWLDYNSPYASVAPGSRQSCVTVGDAATTELNMTLLKKTTIRGKVQDNLGQPKKWVWVTATSCNDKVAASDRVYYGGGSGGSSNAEGDYSLIVGAADGGTEYCLHAEASWNDRFKEGLTLPPPVKVTCKAGETCTADALVFRLMNGEFKIQVKASSTAGSSDIVKGAFVSGYSGKCDSAEAEADSQGVAVIPCVGGDTYQFAARNKIDDVAYISEAVELVCKPEQAVAADLFLTKAGKVPVTVSKVCKDTDSCSALLSDGFSVTLPRNACGTTGKEISLSVVPTLTLPLQCAARPAGLYGYNITVTDAAGKNCTKLEGEATLCTPLNKDVVAAQGLDPSECNLVFLDRGTDSYKPIASSILDPNNLKICGSVNHFTEFVIVGKGDIKAVDGNSETAAERAARTGEVSGTVGTAGTITGGWGEGVGVKGGDVSGTGEVAGGGNVGPSDGGDGGSDLPANPGSGGCTLLPIIP